MGKLQVVRNITDLNTALAANTVAQCGFQRKNNGELHAGHVACIAAANVAADISLISFFPHEEIMNYLFDTNIPVPLNWDESYCINFCEDNGVDVVFIPTFSGVLDIFFGGLTVSGINDLINGALSMKGYDGYSGKTLDYTIVMEYLRKTKNLYTKSATIFSTKDGYKSFARKNYYETELNIPCVLIDMIYRPDGLPEATAFTNMPQQNLDVLVQMYNIMKGKSYEYLYSLNDFESLTNELNACDTKTTKTIFVDFIRCRKEGLIGANKILLEASIFAGSESEVVSLVVIKEQIV